MEHNLTKNVRIVLVSTGIAASATSTDHYTSCVDTLGFDGVYFHCVTETTDETAWTAYAQLSATSSGTGTFIDVYGSTVTHSTGFGIHQTVLGVDIYQPTRRWARMYFDRGTTGQTISDVSAFLYRAHDAGVTQSSDYDVCDINIVRGTSS